MLTVDAEYSIIDIQVRTWV